MKMPNPKFLTGLATAAALIGGTLAVSAPAEAKMCRNSHGHYFHCHHVIKPRINFHRHPAIRVEQCRGHKGHADNKC